MFDPLTVDIEAQFRQTPQYKAALEKVLPIIDKLWCNSKKDAIFNDYDHVIWYDCPKRKVSLGSDKQHATDHLCRLLTSNPNYKIHVGRYRWHNLEDGFDSVPYDRCGYRGEFRVATQRNWDGWNVQYDVTLYHQHRSKSRSDTRVLLQAHCREFEWYGDEEVTQLDSIHLESYRKLKMLDPNAQALSEPFISEQITLQREREYQRELAEWEEVEQAITEANMPDFWRRPRPERRYELSTSL